MRGPTSANALQQWGNFGLATAAGGSPIPNPITSGNPTTAINIVGLVVNLDDAFLSATCDNSMIGAELTWEGSKATPTWSTQVKTGNLGTSTTSGDYTLGPRPTRPPGARTHGSGATSPTRTSGSSSRHSRAVGHPGSNSTSTGCRSPSTTPSRRRPHARRPRHRRPTTRCTGRDQPASTARPSATRAMRPVVARPSTRAVSGRR